MEYSQGKINLPRVLKAKAVKVEFANEVTELISEVGPEAGPGKRHIVVALISRDFNVQELLVKENEA